jgi:hypothetical protein
MVGILVVSVLAALSVVVPAFARGGAIQATDPSANSPAGVVYSIPLDSARQDASPHGHGGGSHSGGAGGTGSGSGGSGSGGSGSGVSDSGGSGGSAAATSGSGSTGSGSAGSGSASVGRGSVSAASGAAHGAKGAKLSGAALAGGAGVVAATGSNQPVLVPGGQPGSLVHSSNGFGSSSKIPSLNSPASAGLGSVQSNASSAPLLAMLLAAVMLALGGYVGMRTWRTPRRRSLPDAGARSVPDGNA